jgi:hypothetical protein
MMREENHLDDRIKVYVCSFQGLSSLDFVDKESMGHPCVTSRHGENIFAGLKHLPAGALDGHLTEDQLKVLDAVSEFCEENGLEYEIVDIAKLSFVSKLKLMFKGMKAPTLAFRGKRFDGIPSREALEALTSE